MKSNSRFSFLRWALLGLGIIAIVGLTGMNVYSLYALRNNSIESENEAKKLQVTEFADQLRWRFILTFRGLGGLNMEEVEKTFASTVQFPPKATKILNKASEYQLFSGIYYLPANTSKCQQNKDNEEFLVFNSSQNRFISTQQSTSVLCDGLGMAKTRMKVLIDGYKYNNKVIFDTHRSMTFALVNLNKKEVFGYLVMPFDQQFLAEDYLQKELVEHFGNPEESGVEIWLRDWTKDRVIAKSNPGSEYQPEQVKFWKKFTDFFDDWQLEVAYTENPTIAASNASLIKNLIVLIAAFVLLSGALVFMFITAQRERALAQRQAGFLANVTHELKTPLAVMQAAGENLADGRVDNQERLKTYGKHIHNEAIRLRKMIEKLLDVAKADVGETMIEPKVVCLASLVRQYINEHRSYIEEQGFTLETSIPERIPPTKLDIESFEAIIGNLIENAIKYSWKEKYINLSLYESEGEITLRVEDHGSGISKKSMKHIFEKFYRAEDTLKAKTKGHGLGLSIVKNLVELNGGTIEVESEESRGTTFLVSFPIIEEEEDEVFENPVLAKDVSNKVQLT